jgi:hypothetical protein
VNEPRKLFFKGYLMQVQATYCAIGEEERMVYINESQPLARTYARASLFIKTAGKCLYLSTIGVTRRENRVLIGKLWELLERRAPPLEISPLVPAQVSVHLHE